MAEPNSWKAEIERKAENGWKAEIEPLNSVYVNNGKIISPRVIDKIISNLEKGAMRRVHGIIVHQTATKSAAGTLRGYTGLGANGGHFLIDKDGTIYQTARITQRCNHVGNIKSRCRVLNTCSAEEFNTINAILKFKKGEAYNVKFKGKSDYEIAIAMLSEHEKAKSYPNRYPANDDSLGIEIQGYFSHNQITKRDVFDQVTFEQNDSLTWLVRILQEVLELSDRDVYRHPEVSEKTKSEAQTANWNLPQN